MEQYLQQNEFENKILKLTTEHPQPGRHSFDEHRHIEFEICCVKSGSGVYKTPQASYLMRPNDIFLFRSNEVHWISEIDIFEPMTLVNIHFEPRLIWSSETDFFNPNLIHLFVDKRRDFCNRLDRKNPMRKRILALFLSIENEFSQQREEYQLMIKLNLLNIFVLLHRHFGYGGADYSNDFTTSNSDAIEKSMDYIHAHLTEDLTLARIARIANMSETYYSSVFKKLNGTSPWGYITSKRIELAKNYLLDNKGTMLDLAMKCGFKNTANFNKTFKKYTGLTPTEYRNNALSHTFLY